MKLYFRDAGEVPNDHRIEALTVEQFYVDGERGAYPESPFSPQYFLANSWDEVANILNASNFDYVIIELKEK